MYHNQSPYHRRRAHSLAKSKERNIGARNDRYLQIDRFMCAYEEAHFQLYRVRTTVTYSKGWYFVHGKRVRHSTLQSMTNTLLAKLQELESPNPDRKEQDDE